MAAIQIAMQDASRAAASASGSSFQVAIRILPAPQREAMFQIYAFCRAVDDIADGAAARSERLAALARWRDDIAICYPTDSGLAYGPPPERVAALHAAIVRFHLQQADFLAIIDGMEMDALTDLCAPEDAVLDLYCDRVASAVGRLAVRVFGMEEQPGTALAHHLGRALQLTNILRDVDEDAALGRMYLPASALRAAGIPCDAPRAIATHPALGSACSVVARLAHRHYDEAQAVMDACPRRPVRSPRIMAAVYRTLLARLQQTAWTPPRARIRLPRMQLAWIVLRHAFV